MISHVVTMVTYKALYKYYYYYNYADIRWRKKKTEALLSKVVFKTRGILFIHLDYIT